MCMREIAKTGQQLLRTMVSRDAATLSERNLGCTEEPMEPKKVDYEIWETSGNLKWFARETDVRSDM
jgi:hypothetical protein